MAISGYVKTIFYAQKFTMRMCPLHAVGIETLGNVAPAAIQPGACGMSSALLECFQRLRCISDTSSQSGPRVQSLPAPVWT